MTGEGAYTLWLRIINKDKCRKIIIILKVLRIKLSYFYKIANIDGINQISKN